MYEDERRFRFCEEYSIEPQPLLRYYQWAEASITLGYRQASLKPVYVERDQFKPCQVAVRPTGGGIVEHQPGELTYALFLPAAALPNESMENVFKWLSQPLLSTLQDFGVNAYLKSSNPPMPAGFGVASKARGTRHDLYALCFADMAGYEIGFEGKKILGQAQRMGRHVFLAQGTFQNLPLPQKDYAQFMQKWGEKIEEALQVWGANSRASDLGIPRVIQG